MSTQLGNKIICSVYRSSKKAGMYLYVEKDKGLERVPSALLDIFGKPVQALTLLLTPEKKLANADIKLVMEKLNDVGYFLQMPPQVDEYMQKVNEKNSKLER